MGEDVTYRFNYIILIKLNQLVDGFFGMSLIVFTFDQLAKTKQAVGGIDKLIDAASKDKAALAVIQCVAEEDRFDKVLDNPQVIVQPIVRNGKKATAGYQPDVWKSWD